MAKETAQNLIGKVFDLELCLNVRCLKEQIFVTIWGSDDPKKREGEKIHKQR